MFFLHVKTTIHLIRIANDVLSRERKMIRTIKSHRSVRVSRQNLRLFVVLAACSALACLLVVAQTISEKRTPQTIGEIFP